MSITPEQIILSKIACTAVCLENDEFVDNFNRLQGRNLGKAKRRTPIEIAIDEATGYDRGKQEDEDMEAFIDAVEDVIWSRLDISVLLQLAEKMKERLCQR